MSEVRDSPELYGKFDETDEIRSPFRQGRFPVAVYGLGKMGLPLASVFAEVCGNVTGVDIDKQVVETINDGHCHIKREPGLSELVRVQVEQDRLSATVDGVQASQQASIHVVIIPIEITESNVPDLSILDEVIATIGEGLTPGDIVLIESTVPPGVTEERVQDRLCRQSGLKRDEYGLAFCPERTSSGRALKDIRGAYPKVVGGVDQASTTIASAIYEEINESGVIQTSDSTTAEAVKVFEGLYRDVNIALANELAKLTDELGIDVREAIDVANTQPFCDIHDPGPGVGGHCIPYYPYFIIGRYSGSTSLLEAARSVNDSMPSYTVMKLTEELEADGHSLESASVLLLGLTYRPGVEEIRASPALPIASELSERGVNVFGTDPMLDSYDEFDLNPVDMDNIYDQPYDAVVIITEHAEFNKIDWNEFSSPSNSLIVIDGRDMIEVTSDFPHRVYTLGSGMFEKSV